MLGLVDGYIVVMIPLYVAWDAQLIIIVVRLLILVAWDAQCIINKYQTLLLVDCYIVVMLLFLVAEKSTTRAKKSSNAVACCLVHCCHVTVCSCTHILYVCPFWIMHCASQMFAFSIITTLVALVRLHALQKIQRRISKLSTIVALSWTLCVRRCVI